MSTVDLIRECELEARYQNGLVITKNKDLFELILLKDVNGLIIEDFFSNYELTNNYFKLYLDTLDQTWGETLYQNIAHPHLKSIIQLLGAELGSNEIGVHCISKASGLCPRPHFDQLPIRILSAFNGPGPVLIDSQNIEFQAKNGDLVFMKGSLWQSDIGPLKHYSPKSDDQRLLLRIDFLN